MKSAHVAYAAALLPIAIALTGCADSSKEESEKSMIKPPVAEKKPLVLTDHGMDRTDNYFWLRARENPEVIAYLEAENEYTQQQLSDVSDLRNELFEEIKGRIQQTDMSVPYTLKGYSYYARYQEGEEYPYYCRKATGNEEEQVMLDVNEMAKPFSYYQAVALEVSHDNKLLAFAEDTLSRRIYTIRFKNLETGEFLPDRIEGTTGRAAWAKDNKTVFYTKKDPITLRSDKIYRHILGTPVTEDVMVYHEEDDTFDTGIGLSKSDAYLIIQSGSTMTSEYRVLESDKPEGDFRIIHKRERGLEYEVDHYQDHFYILHNGDAVNFKLSRTGVNNTARSNWEDVIAHREEVLLESFEIFQDFLVIDERKDGLTNLRVLPWDKTKLEHSISFNDPAYTAYLSTNPEFNTSLVRYGYSSLTTPNSIFDYNATTKDSQLLKRQEVIGKFNPDDYVSERIFATGRDGTSIPISIVYGKDFKKDGTQPLLLYAYGSYGSTMDAYFSSARLSLLDRGFAYAIAHIRGGQEMGRKWYEDGKLLNKKNTFYDFIDCGEHLIAENFASPQTMYAMGGSAGGLLMGAVVNMRPDMWNGVVAQVPFVDVINTMLDASIPLTTGEYDEWGNPNDKAYYDYIMSYSPYDNVKEQDYPSMLVTTGLHDSQVQYWEPAKWVAKLRDMKTDDNLLVLHTEMTAGHGGASGRFEQLKEVALEYAFLLKLAGKTD